jgi:Mg-chelatase subunit ChlD
VDLAQGPTKEDRQAEAERRLEEARRLAAEKKRQALLAMEKSASDEAFSTFSLHVSDVSFKLAQAALEKGEWPEAERVRVEEFVNAFDYGDPAPSRHEKVACALEQAAHPFMQQRNLLRIAMRTAAVGRASGTPLRLTVLLDNSGSMERSDRAESVQRAFDLLAAQMNPQDEVTLISFARTPRLVRDSVPGDKVGELVKIIRDTPSEGGTNLEEALRLGLEKAREDFLEGAQNRIILLTDGAANLGNAEPEMLGAMVEQMRQEGIAFDACGVGADGLNDDVLEALTRKGDGRYYFLDRPEDADAGFAKQIAGALRPAAKNVKVQVEFNPKRVGHYRLYGFEKHELKKEDFRDDKVDAAEMAAEEAGVAMYQVETLPDGEGDVGSVSVRFQDMATGGMVEKRWPIPYETNPADLAEAAPSMKLAASAAFLGETLKGTPVGDMVELGELAGVSRSLQTIYPADERVVQLIEMIEKARAMAR